MEFKVMTKAPGMPQADKKNMIRVMIVDDIPETRENLKKLLAFEPDIEVVGTASTGREGVDLALAKKPDIILMDINMPDMDGIQATEAIHKAVASAGVIMMSVQSESDYLRRAMLAGARDFLTKPISGDELYATVRRVYELMAPIREQNSRQLMPAGVTSGTSQRSGPAEGHILVVYSPQGGVGKTTVATNLAAALMREGTKVLLVDCDLQFGDVGVFLNLQAQNTLTELSHNALEEDLDMDLVENVLIKHDSGLKVLLAPLTPEDAETVVVDGVVKLLGRLKASFDFIVVDTATRLDDMTLNLFDLAERILLVGNPTLPSLKNMRIVLNLIENMKYPEERIQLIFNRVNLEYERTRVVPPVSAFEQKLKRTAVISIPADDRKVLAAQTRGTPLIAAKDRNISPAKEFIALADLMRAQLTPETPVPAAQSEPTKVVTTGRLSGLFGKRSG
jgi:pilus assembly protein CpaE